MRESGIRVYFGGGTRRGRNELLVHPCLNLQWTELENKNACKALSIVVGT